MDFCRPVDEMILILFVSEPFMDDLWMTHIRETLDNVSDGVPGKQMSYTHSMSDRIEVACQGVSQPRSFHPYFLSL